MGQSKTELADEDLLEISFAHPRSPRTYEASVLPSGTLGECIAALVAEGFLEPETEAAKYLATVKRTNTALTRDLSFAEAKIASGDAIALAVAGKGGAAWTRP